MLVLQRRVPPTHCAIDIGVYPDQRPYCTASCRFLHDIRRNAFTEYDKIGLRRDAPSSVSYSHSFSASSILFASISKCIDESMLNDLKITNVSTHSARQASTTPEIAAQPLKHPCSHTFASNANASLDAAAEIDYHTVLTTACH